ncbi:MAG: roadblock/LC7 domain-containing protein [Candidatus Heimdallarchaeota archaeon]|nr:roadblock/LC7 domain-containing protein [Candidatus Heimdallarchaeota archaeon]
MQQRDDIHRELTRLLKSDTSIKITLLGDRTGLTIARASRLLVSETMGAFDLESIGAIASAVFCGAAEQGSALTLGSLGIMLAEFSDGKILTAQSGERGVLVVVAESDAQLGLIRMRMKESSESLSNLMDRLTEPSAVKIKKPESQSIMSALKELDNF